MGEMSIGEFARRSRLSAKALRLYDELGLLVPARVDQLSGYRFYEDAQLDQARLIAALGLLGVSLAQIEELLPLGPEEVAAGLAELWRVAEEQHAARRELATLLVDQLQGRKTAMNEVAAREVPERTLLCLKRNVDEAGAWALGKAFVGTVRDQRLPRMEGRQGAMFSIYWGQVSTDSDGPVEWCKPVPGPEAESLAAQFPDLTLRVEPAHREAYVSLGQAGPGGLDPAAVAVAVEALRSWADEQGIAEENLSLTPEDLGVRITYLASGPPDETSGPDCDFAVPFA
jgi:DNA-binding transcriptional MerR regulator